ncbi:MAG: hypothetical protein ACI4O8_08205 [Aristaeellaceae bacterium]
MKRSKFDIRGAYEKAMHSKNGALPNIVEVAALSGASVETVRYHLRHMGLNYERMTQQESGSISARRMHAEAEERFVSAYEAFLARHGRAPSPSELNLALGLALNSSHVSKVAKRLGMELSRKRRKREKPEVRVIAPPNPEFRFGSGTSPRMDKVLAIKDGTECAPEEGWAHRPGEAYTADDRIMITCPVCGARRMIAPRMHPYWIRNKAGAVIFVCRDACTGRVTGG